MCANRRPQILYYPLLLKAISIPSSPLVHLAQFSQPVFHFLRIRQLCVRWWKNKGAQCSWQGIFCRNRNNKMALLWMEDTNTKLEFVGQTLLYNFPNTIPFLLSKTCFLDPSHYFSGGKRLREEPLHSLRTEWYSASCTLWFSLQATCSNNNKVFW